MSEIAQIGHFSGQLKEVTN